MADGSNVQDICCNNVYSKAYTDGVKDGKLEGRADVKREASKIIEDEIADIEMRLVRTKSQVEALHDSLSQAKLLLKKFNAIE